MSRPDEGLIHQWLDGECTPEESAEIERLIATDAAWAAAVAEARGLIAASSRIVGALDAVPHAMPKGSRAAPSAQPIQSLHLSKPMRPMPAWMKVAAAAVIVAGTAYALREQVSEPFRPAATAVDGGALPQPTMSAPNTQVTEDPRELRVPTSLPTNVPAIGPARNADVAPPPSPVASAPVASPPPPALAQAEAAGAAGAGVAEKTSTPVSPPVSAPVSPSPRALDIARAEDAVSTRRARMSAEAPRGAIGRLDGVVVTGASAPAKTLEGCWRVSAPPELLGVLNAPVIRRESGDTLVLVTARGDITVVRAGDELRGGLQAKLEGCGAKF